MKNLYLGLLTFFNSTQGTFWADVNGQLYDTEADPSATYPYAVYSIMSDVDSDTFTENNKNIYLQIALYSATPNDKSQILDMDTHLTDWLKDKIFAASGWTVVSTKRLQGTGPYSDTVGTTETGLEKVWKMDVDFELLVSKN